MNTVTATTPAATPATTPAATPADPTAGRLQELRAAARALGSAGGGTGAAKLLQLLYDPDVDLDRVLACLRSDPALAARVLKVANSPYYRLSGHVGTIERAVQLLGLAAIRGIAAAGCLDRLAPPRAGAAFEPERFRRHSLAVACAAQMLSHAGSCGIDGEAFITGLLHDIGLLVLIKLDAAAMGRFVPPNADDAGAARAAELTHFGTTHEQCAAVLVETWALPVWLRDALAAHHERGAAPTGQGLATLPALLALADHVAERAGYGLWPVCAMAPAAGVAASLHLDAEALERIAAELPEAMARLAPN